MLGKEEIQNLAYVNPEVALQLLELAGKRVKELANAARVLENKMNIMRGADFTVLLLSLGLTLRWGDSITVIFTPMANSSVLLSAILAAVTVVSAMLAAVFAFVALRYLHGGILTLMAYGAGGTDPEIWLSKDYLSVRKKKMGKIYAYILHDHVARIRESEASNDKKRKCYEKALRWNTAMVVSLFVCLVVRFWPWLSDVFCALYAALFESP